jgi:hypothetical protein
VVARKAGADQPEDQARRSDPLRVVALGGPDAIHRRRPHRDRLQCRRASTRPHSSSR